LQEAAALSMFQIGKPGPGLLSAVLDRVRGLTRMDSLGATSMLLLGALARRSEGRLIDRLLGLEKHARSLGASDVWLQALGNSGSDVALERARPYFQASEEWVRAAAVSAVRKLETPAAFDLLAQRAARDDSLAVRARAIDSLASSKRPAAARRLVDLLKGESQVQPRRLLLMGLGRHAAWKNASAERALRAAASRDPAPELRQLARRLLRNAASTRS
jgi:HEAT repeat protein